MKKMSVGNLVLASLLFAGANGLSQVAADPVQDMEDCAEIAVEEERLACFDAAYAQLQAAGMTSDSILESRVIRVKVPVPVASPAGGAIPQPAAAKDKSGIFSGFGRPFGGKKKDVNPESFGKPVDTVERAGDGTIKTLYARVIEVNNSASGRPTVTLDNGQRWRPNEGRLRPKVGQMARIKKGGMGGYFLSVDGGRSVRAVRLGDSTSSAPTAAATPQPTAPVEEVKAEKEKKGIFSRFGLPFGGKKKDASEQDFGKTPAATGEERKSSPKSMTQKVSAVLQDPTGNYIITLEDGQVWQQTDGRIKIRTGDMVTIDKGAMGGHFLQVNNEGRSIRVRRVD